MPRATCPSCKGVCEIATEDWGQELECPYCATVFTPPKLTRRTEPDEFEEDLTNEDRPLNSNARRRSNPRRPARRRPKSYPLSDEDRRTQLRNARTIGKWLTIAGFVALLIHILICLGLLLGSYLTWDQQNQNLNPNQKELPIILLVYGIFAGIPCLLCLPSIVAGYKLRHAETMETVVWPVLAGIINLVCLFLCLIAPTFWALAGLGIWAMITTLNADFQQLLRDNQEASQEFRPDEKEAN